MNSFLLILQSSSKQRFWIMFCHHKSVLPGVTQKRRFQRIFHFLRMQRDKGGHPSTVARAILCHLTTIWLSKTFSIVFANVIAEVAKENILNEAWKGFSLLQCLWNDGRLHTRIFNGVVKLYVSLQLYCWATLWGYLWRHISYHGNAKGAQKRPLNFSFCKLSEKLIGWPTIFISFLENSLNSLTFQTIWKKVV